MNTIVFPSLTDDSETIERKLRSFVAQKQAQHPDQVWIYYGYTLERCGAMWRVKLDVIIDDTDQPEVIE